jgi:hypothetical protein
VRIRIHLIRIRIQHFRLNSDPDPGFWHQKLKKIYSWIFFFLSKTIFKTWNFLIRIRIRIHWPDWIQIHIKASRIRNNAFAVRKIIVTVPVAELNLLAFLKFTNLGQIRNVALFNSYILKVGKTLETHWYCHDNYLSQVGNFVFVNSKPLQREKERKIFITLKISH